MSAGTRLSTTCSRRAASGSLERRAAFAIAFVLIGNGVAACAVQPRMVTLSDPSRTGDCRQVSSRSPVQVTWIAPDSPDHRQKLDDVCAAVGPAVVQAGETTTRLEQGVGVPLVVVVWNTYLGRGNLEELVGKLQHGEFTAGVPVARFALLLQEVYRTSILQFAQEHNISVVFAPTRRLPREADDRGGAILATGPLDEVTIIELPFEKQRRVAVGARFGSIQLVNVHLDTRVGLLRGGPGAARRRQARALREAVAGLPGPLLVGGDWNTWWGDDEPAIKEMRQVFPDARPIAARETWRGPLRTGNKLDYVFARGFNSPVDVRRLADRFGSDHWPLIATPTGPVSRAYSTRTTPATIPR